MPLDPDQIMELQDEVEQLRAEVACLREHQEVLRSVLRDARAWIPSTVHDETNNDTWTGTVKTNPMLLRIDAVLGSTK